MHSINGSLKCLIISRFNTKIAKMAIFGLFINKYNFIFYIGQQAFIYEVTEIYCQFACLTTILPNKYHSNNFGSVLFNDQEFIILANYSLLLLYSYSLVVYFSASFYRIIQYIWCAKKR